MDLLKQLTSRDVLLPVGEPDPTDQQTGWFERHLPVIANTVVVAGVVLTVVSFFRK